MQPIKAVRFFVMCAAVLSLAGASRAENWWGNIAYSPYGSAMLGAGTGPNPYSVNVTGGAVTGSLTTKPLNAADPGTAEPDVLNLNPAFPNANYIKVQLNRSAKGSRDAETSAAGIRCHLTGGVATQTRTVKLMVEAQAYAWTQIQSANRLNQTTQGKAAVSAEVSFSQSDLQDCGATATINKPLAVYGYPDPEDEEGPWLRHKFTDAPAPQRCIITRQVTFDSDGEADVYIPFQIDLHAEYDAPLWSDQVVWGSVGVSQNFVIIESTEVPYGIEDSWRKTTDASHPIEKYRDGIKPPGSCNPVGDTGAGLLNERNPNGSITVDSVAQWDDLLQTWEAQGIFNARHSPMSAPSYSWLWSLGTVAGAAGEHLAANTDRVNINPYNGPLGDLNGVDLGGDILGSGMVSSSILHLTVTDGNSNPLSTSFTIRWHLPYEKLCDLPNGPQMKDVFDKVGLIDSGQALNVTLQEKHFDYNAAIDSVLVIGSAAGLPTKQAEELWSIFKAIMDLSQLDLTQPSAYAEEIQVLSTNIPNDVNTFQVAVDTRPENIQGLAQADRQQMIDDRDYWTWDKYDCYAYRVRYHHLKRALADKYDIHGFHSPEHVLSTDITETHGDGTLKIGFENFYVPLDGIPPTLGDKNIDEAILNGGIR